MNHVWNPFSEIALFVGLGKASHRHVTWVSARSPLLAMLILLFANHAYADVTVVGSNSAVNSTSSPTSISLSIPSGTQPGDLLVAHLAVRSGLTITAPSGWTSVVGPTTRDDVRHQVWYRTVPALSLGTQTWSFSSGSRAVLGMISLRGADSANPISLTGTSQGNTATATAPSVSVSSAGSYLLAFFSGDDGNTAMSNGTASNSPAWSFATGGGTGSGVTGALFHRALPAAGATGTSQATAPDDWIASTVIVNSGSGLTCFSDQFNRTGIGTDWAVGSSSGSFGSPTIVSNRLRITNNSGNVATSATLQRLFPATGNFVQIEFTLHAYGGSGADGIAIILSDSTVAPVPGGYGGSLGYAQRDGVNGFAGGWMGVGLDEYGNFANPTESRIGGPGFVSDAVTIRGSGSGTTGYRFVAGTGSLSPGVDGTPSGGHRYRITINAVTAGTVAVTVERDTAGTGAYTTLINVANILSATGQAALPANLIFSLTGSTGGSTNIHEIDDLGVCASSINPMAQIDHIRFVTDADALTCQPETVTMYACSNSSCSSLYTAATSVSLTPSANWVGGNVASFSGGSGSKQAQLTTPGTLAIGVSGSTPTAINAPRCFTAAPPGGTEIACNILFRDSGFAFDVPDLTANKLVNAIKVRAVRKDLTTQQCIPAFANVTRTVRWYGRYLNPTTGTLPVFVSDANESQNITTVASAAAAPTGTAFGHVFDGNGETTINVRYSDAGQLQMNASYSGSAGTGDTGLVMTGTDNFVSIPAGFCVQARTPISSPTTALAECTSSACPMYQKAGVDFPLRIRAMAWEVDGETDNQFCSGNSVTPNFAGTVSLSHDMADSVIDGSFSTPSVTLSAGTLDTTANFSEVGRFVLSTGGSYLGVSLPASKSVAIGRIVPDHFDLTINGYSAHCTSTDASSTTDDFSFAGLSGGSKTGQIFSLGTQVLARNSSGVTTQNYQGSYAKLQSGALSFTDWDSAIAASDGLFVAATHSLNFISGVATHDPSVLAGTSRIDVNYQFNSQRAPYTIGLRAEASDSDGIVGSSTTQGPIAFRMGRLLLENAYGPELLPLAIPLRSEYFDGSRWRRNTFDSCTSYSIGQGTRDQWTGTLSDSETEFDRPVASTNLVAGIASTAQPLRIEAPGNGEYGTLRIQYSLPSWLLFDWDADGDHDDGPSAIATFGRYRGSDRVIYWRERLPVIP